MFNDDVPYDQFVREQLAGNFSPAPASMPGSALTKLIGPCYHMGEHRHGSSYVFNGVHQEMSSNKIEAFSKASLATTVACSRCHDQSSRPSRNATITPWPPSS